jgi:hypothetical protein
MGIETAALASYAAVASAAVGAASTAYSIHQQGKASDAQEEAQDISSAQQKSVDLANKRQQMREERIKRAQIEQAASNQGVGGSSGEAGAVSALGTQVGTNIATINQGAKAAQGIGNAMSTAAGYSHNAQIAQGVSSLAGTVFSGAGGFSTIFGTGTGINPPPTETTTQQISPIGTKGFTL